MKTFEKLGLSLPIIDVLKQLGFTTPTEIQEQAIPQLLENNPTHFIGLAQTGTGKTAAFGLPLLEMINQNDSHTQALIMAPTRELGQQTAKQLTDFSKNQKNIKIEVVYGGAAIIPQVNALKKPTQIVVATPGRLLDLIKRKAVSLAHVKHIVLDEADEILNRGFKKDIDEILGHTSTERVIWLFSATMPNEIRRMIKKYMQNPIEVKINVDEKSNRDIAHKFLVTTSANRLPALRRLMDLHPDMRGVLFCRTKIETQKIADEFLHYGYNVEALHGNLSQAQRDAVMKRFKKRGMQLLIATDVAARGIDVKDLTHVIQHNLPEQLESYTHRSGRTGRAGKKGTSLVFINSREVRKISELEKRLNIKFEKISVPTVEELKLVRINHWANLIINTGVDEQSEEILESVRERFADLSKEDILKRLITTQLDHLMTVNESGDLNESHESSSAKHSSTGGVNRYFVNLGSIDGMTQADLIHFLSDISKLDRKHFMDLKLLKNCSFFNLDVTIDNNLSNQFKGIEIDGRKIRVNREEANDNKDSAPKKRRPGGRNKSFKRVKASGSGVRSAGNRWGKAGGLKKKSGKKESRF